jgi:hypothetical protein
MLIGIGVQKCATTWLYEILRDHPQVALSARKELDFFSCRFDRGQAWYEAQFPVGGERRVRGEISPSYFLDPEVPGRIAACVPGAHLLVALRDPVERALSNHRHEVRLGTVRGPDLSFETGLANNPLYLEQSRYGTHLRRWLKQVPASRLLILLQEDIDRCPIATAARVYGFVGVDQDHVSAALDSRPNESHVYRYLALEVLRRGARGAARTLGLDGVWQAAQGAGLQALYRRLNRRRPDTRIPPVAPQTLERLRRVLADEVRMVEEILERPLPQWREGASETEPAGSDPAAGAYPVIVA